MDRLEYVEQTVPLRAARDGFPSMWHKFWAGDPISIAGASCCLNLFDIQLIRCTGKVLYPTLRTTSSTRYLHNHRDIVWTPPQERRGLCQAPDTRMWLNARKVRRDFVCFHPQAPRWKGIVSSFPTRYPAPSESSHEAVRTPDLESRLPTLFLGRAWRTAYFAGGKQTTSRIKDRDLQSTAPTGPSPYRFIGAYHHRQYTLPLCLLGVRGPGIAELCSVASRVASRNPTILSILSHIRDTGR